MEIVEDNKKPRTEEVEVVCDDVVEEDLPVSADVNDTKWREELHRMATEVPEVRWYHPAKFTEDEDKIIAAAIVARKKLYRIAETIRCSRVTLSRHIENTPFLQALYEEAKSKECDQIDEAIDELVSLRHPSVVMWKAEKLMPEKYGKDRQVEEEDDTRIVFGAIPDEAIAAGDAIIADANSKPPEVGLAALVEVGIGTDIGQKAEVSEVDDGTPTLDNINKAPAQEVAQEQKPEQGTNIEDSMGMSDGAGDDVYGMGGYGDGYGGYDDYGGGSGGWMG